MVVFFVKSNENIYPKGRALMQMYREEGIMGLMILAPANKEKL